MGHIGPHCHAGHILYPFKKGGLCLLNSTTLGHGELHHTLVLTYELKILVHI